MRPALTLGRIPAHLRRRRLLRDPAQQTLEQPAERDGGHPFLVLS
jgi:hypothetical protein